MFLLVFRKEQKGVSLIVILLIAIEVTLVITASAIILPGEWLPTNIVGSGNLVTQQKDFSDFSAIQVSNANALLFMSLTA
jgi:hypothetical protein